MVAPGVGFARGDHIEAQLALGRLDATVGLPRRHPHLVLGLARHDGPVGDVPDGLLQDAQALAHLINADEVAVVHIAVIAHGHVEVKAVVNAVGVGPADVVRHARSPQHRTRGGEGDGFLRREHAHADGPALDELALRQIPVQLIHLPRQPVGDQLHQFLPGVLGDVPGHTAKTEVVVHHTGAGDRLKHVQDELPLLNGVQGRGEEGPQVVQQKPNGPQVVHDTGELGHDDPDVLGSLRRLDTHELLHRQHVAEVVGHGRDVIQAVGIRDVHNPRVPLAYLLVVAV